MTTSAYFKQVCVFLAPEILAPGYFHQFVSQVRVDLAPIIRNLTRVAYPLLIAAGFSLVESQEMMIAIAMAFQIVSMQYAGTLVWLYLIAGQQSWQKQELIQCPLDSSLRL
jgi:hypothetical protein